MEGLVKFNHGKLCRHLTLGLVLFSFELTGQKPCHYGGDNGRLPLTEARQEGEEQAITRHGKDNVRQGKHGAQQTEAQNGENGERERE